MHHFASLQPKWKSRAWSILGHRLNVIIALLIFCGFAAAGAGTAASAAPASNPGRRFTIHVVDDQTGRGVPLVQLRTVSNLSFYTDSGGLVSLDDPGLMDQKVYFSVSSDGYEIPADGFGNRGQTLDVVPGGSATIKIKRLNIAERIYRVTGQGIYRDTVLAGGTAPIRHPLLNAQVVGQDSVQAIPYHGKLYWFWGDTNRLSYPLGHFGMAGATSELPGNGGLDPSVGVDLNYFTDASGFSRPTCDVAGPGPKWIEGVMAVKDDQGRERLVARYSRMKSLSVVLERGLVIWDDASDLWKPLARFDLKLPLYPSGQPFRYTDGGVEYFYFPTPMPNIRVPANLKSITDPGKYEAYTCLVAGTRFDKGTAQCDRDSKGKLIWAWKHDTGPVGPMQERELVAAGKIRPEDTRFLLQDLQSGRAVVAHGGSICWNAYRNRWLLIAVEIGGQSSYLGEVWYSEAEAPLGPWHWARKIVTHNRYSFYNPVQHPFFDQKGGQVIYFEGTYASTFSGNDHPRPLYDYNQIMYRLDLADPRLATRGSGK
jgi:hypothetical protein